jgi:peroxiredoxin
MASLTSPRPERVLRDFVLLSAEGKPVQVSDFRGRANLVLLFTPSSSLLGELACEAEKFREQEAQVLAVLPCPREEALQVKQRLKFPFLLLSDSELAVHRSIGAVDAQARPRATLYITDRFGEIFASFRESAAGGLPRVSDILEWLEFINRQCPECFPPEWPA